MQRGEFQFEISIQCLNNKHMQQRERPLPCLQSFEKGERYGSVKLVNQVRRQTLYKHALTVILTHNLHIQGLS